MSRWGELRRQLTGGEHGEDDLDGARLIERLFQQRLVAGAALAVTAALVPVLPGIAALVILATSVVTNLVAFHEAKRLGRVPLWLHASDLAACLAFPVFFPVTFVPAALLMLAIVCLTAVVNGRVWAAALGLVGTIGLVVLELTIGFDQGPVAIVGFGVGAFMIATAVGRLANAEAELRTRLNAVVDNLDAALWVRDPGTDRVTFVNQRTLSLLGWTEDDWHRPGFWQAHVHPDDREAAVLVMDQSAALGLDHESTYRIQAADGRWVHLHARVTALTEGNGRTLALQSMGIDVTDRVDIEHRVNQYAAIVDRIDLALLVLRLDDDAEGTLRMTAANPAAARLVNRDLLPLVGTTLEEAFPVLAGSRLSQRLAAVVERGTPLRVDDLVVQPDGGENRIVTLRAFPLSDRSVGVSLQDVTDAVAASEALRRQALYDSLTGLPNRRLLDEELHRVLADTPLPGETIALLVMDLDQFKEVNDALGHHVGDQLLRGIGDRLTKVLEDALVARLGGDEFAVVLAGLIDEDGARGVADQIRRTLAEPFILDEVRLQSNASIGIAIYPHHARDVPTLIQRADVAMYMAKRAGSGVAVYAAEHDRSSIERLTLISDLPDAAPNGEFVLHFQPCVNLRTGSTVRAEALVRWNHPRLGLLGPDQFVGLAELSGAIQPLTRWVIAEGLAAVRAWRNAGHDDLGLALNLSVRNLYDPDLISHLVTALALQDLPPSALVLELTETELMDDPGLARDVFTTLGELGISTSIDDFGTGYSSLTYLRDLPLQEIKIDRSFVGEMHRRSDEFAIVRSMIDLGHNLGLEVVAEGVEHADDLELLRRLGCDHAQGFHLSRPLPLHQLLAWLDARRTPLPADVPERV